MMIALVDLAKSIKSVVADISMDGDTSKKVVLVTGGAGYIGSHTAWLLQSQGYQVVVLDNLYHDQQFNHSWATFIKGDLADTNLLHTIFRTYSIDAIMHFAASIEVSESCKDPAAYYKNNVTNTQNLLDVARLYGVLDVIFSSSCAVYGKPQTACLSEHHSKNPISPYGRTKYIVEQMLEDYAQAYGVRYVCFRYFNAAGAAAQYGLFEQHKHESHIIPRLISAVLHKENFFVFGNDYDTTDGTAIRDYVHVLDIADAHIKAFEYLKKGGNSTVYNLGTGKGFSVLELIKKVQEVAGMSVNIVHAPRRLGDPARLVAQAEKACSELGWIPAYSSLDIIIASAYEGYFQMEARQLQQSQHISGIID